MTVTMTAVGYQGSAGVIEELRRLVEEGADGELVVAGEAIEGHVFLVGGAIAWATSSTSHNELSRYLTEECSVAPATIAEVIDECRRTRRPFGETLVAWNVAGVAQVREALRSQIRFALAEIAAGRESRWLFLRRTVAYRSDLTFELGDVLDLSPPPEEAAFVEWARELVHGVTGALPDLSWMLVMAGPEPVAAWTRSGAPPPAVPWETARTIGGTGGRALTVRAPGGSVLGVAHADADVTAWCGLPADGRVGLATSVLSAYMRGGERVLEGASGDVGGPWSVADPAGVLGGCDVLGSLFAQADELVAAAVLRRADGAVATLSRDTGTLERLLGTTRDLGGLLGHPVQELLSGVGPSPMAHAYERVAVQLTGEAHTSYLATIDGPGDLALGLAFTPRALHGLSWALLTTACRAVSHHVGA